jgi:hypothetical protein
MRKWNDIPSSDVVLADIRSRVFDIPKPTTPLAEPS